MRLCVLTRREPDGTYIAVCPSLPGCVTRAKTHKAVLAKHQEAVVGYLASVNNAVPSRISFDVVNERKIAALRRMGPDGADVAGQKTMDF